MIICFHAGVEHEGYICDGCYPPDRNEWIDCIKGIRWNCVNCFDFDLCTDCYMNDEHDKGHEFQRVIAANKRYLQTHKKKTTKRYYVDKKISNCNETTLYPISDVLNKYLTI